MNHRNELSTEPSVQLEHERTARKAFMDDWISRLKEQLQKEPEGERKSQMLQDYALFNQLYEKHFNDQHPLTESVEGKTSYPYRKPLHNKTNAVAVYVVEGTGYDQFGDPLRLQLTRREIHDLNVSTKNGRELLEGLVQLNRKAITDGMAKGQFKGPTISYAYTELVPVYRPGTSDE